jgi:arylsulfatase
MGSRTSLTVYPGMSGLMENAFINVKNRSFSITAEVQIPSSGASGVIIAQGGRFGGWSLWLQDGRPRFTYNWLGIERYEVAADRPMPPGQQVLRFDFAYDGGKPGAAGVGRLSHGGAPLAEGRIARTQPFVFSADEGADVGEDLATPVSEEYQVPARFTGTILKITIDVQPILAADRSAVDAAAVEGLQRQAEFE